MLYAVPTDHSLICSLRKLFCVVVGLCVVALPWFVTARPAIEFQSIEGLRFELPENGNLRVENLRGGVIVELWKEDYASIAAITDSGQQSRSPAVIQRTDSLLSVRVARGPVGAQRINLELHIPARAHAAIITAEGSVEVRGLPAALLIQTVSGEIRVDLPKGAGADVIADSKTGRVSSSLSSVVVDQSARPQLRARVGNGGKGVRLYSQAGNITLAAAEEESSQMVSTPPASPPERRE